MNCQRCKSDKILSAFGKTSDLCFVSYKHLKYEGYVPSGLHIDDDGSFGDYLEVTFCLACGQMQGEFGVLNDDEIRELLNQGLVDNKEW